LSIVAADGFSANAFLRAISQRKEAQAELAASNGRLRDITDKPAAADRLPRQRPAHALLQPTLMFLTTFALARSAPPRRSRLHNVEILLLNVWPVLSLLFGALGAARGRDDLPLCGADRAGTTMQATHLFKSLKFRIVAVAVLTGVSAALGTATLVLGVTQAELQRLVLANDREDRQRNAALLASKLETLKHSLVAVARQARPEL
jgi:hypothetical protein